MDRLGILLAGCVLVSLWQPAPTLQCPKNNGGGSLEWTREDLMGDWQFICDKKFIPMWCCAQGYTRVEWSRRLNGSSTWETYPWAGTSAYTDSKGQHLVLKVVQMSDDGWYRCRATSEAGESIHHDTLLKVDPCASCTDPPIIGQPNARGVKHYKLPGENFTTTCQASFGAASCTDPFDDNSVEWYKAYNSSYCASTRAPTEASPFGSRINNPNLTTSVYENHLQIINITEEDYGLYCCRVWNAIRGNQRDVMIELKPGEPPKTEMSDETLKISMSTLAAFIVLGIILVILLWIFRLELLLFFHVKCSPRRRPGDAHRLQLDFDVILINSGEDSDRRFVEQVLQAHLERELQQDVFLPRRDLDLGYVDNAYIEAIRNSKKIVVILTRDFLAKRLCGNIHDYIINEQRTDDVIYIQQGDIPDALWQTTTNITNIDVLRAAIKNAKRSWLCLGRYLTWRDEYEVDSPLPDGKKISNHKYSRSITKFWKQLHYYLPLKEGVVLMGPVPDQPSPPPNVI